MKLKATIILFLTFLLYQNTKAQNPGYMGKKISAGYGFYFNPAITAALLDYGTHIINTQHEFFIEAAVKRKLALGFFIRLYKSTYNNTGEVDMSRIIKNYSINSYNTEIEPSGTTYIRGVNYAFYLKIFRRAYVAPWGKYFLLGLTLNTRECRYDPYEMNVKYKVFTSGSNVTQVVEYNNFGLTVQNYKYPDLMAGMGNSRIIAKKIVLDYGYNINVAAFVLGIFDAFDFYTPQPENYVQINSGMRVRGINRFNFFVKAGYLF